MLAYSFTFADAIEHLNQFAAGNLGTGQAELRFRQSVDSAYRQLTEERNWHYLYRWDPIFLDAPYTTGTLSYNATTREVTLSGGTWPTWAVYGGLRGLDGDKMMLVESRTSNSVIVLDEDFAPTSNTTADSYALYHTEYILDDDFQALVRTWDRDGVWRQAYVPHADWAMLTSLVEQSGQPIVWSISEARRTLHRWSIYFYPPPDTSRRFDMIVKRRARALQWTGTESVATQGRVAVSGTAVSQVSSTYATAFRDDMVGSIIRFTVDNDANYPDGRFGRNPYRYEGRIKSVTSASALVLESSLGATLTSALYRISDPIDINPSMQEAFLRGIELQWCQSARPSEIAVRAQLYNEALLVAADRNMVSLDKLVAGFMGPDIDLVATWPCEFVFTT